MKMVGNLANNTDGAKFKWINWVPLKINCFVWRLSLDRIPLSNNLVKRGISVNSMACKLCNMGDESVDHVFFRCDFALCVWNWICNWSKLMGTAPIDFDSFLACATSLKPDLKRCNERNERFFGKRSKKPMQLADEIHLYSFNWVKNRSNAKNMD
ncbi:hypothetical protein LXL04_009340 [Taraxacum kok-saghyz]